MKTSLFLIGAVSSLFCIEAPAATLYGTTIFGRLISFDSASPGTLVSDVPITGLTSQFEAVQGIDFRPATGQLYALGNAPGSIFRLYTINTATGVATRVGSTDLTLSGTFWGIDFNPTVDRIRLVSDTGTSLRVHPDTGALVATDTSTTPTGVVAVAYDRNDNDAATATTLYGLDSTTDSLVRIGGIDGNPSPNGGVVTAIGLLGIDTTGFASLDIYNASTAFAAMAPGAPIPSNLYTINLNTGAATLVGVIGNGQDGLNGLAAVPEPGSAGLLGFAALLLCARPRRKCAMGR